MSLCPQCERREPAPGANWCTRCMERAANEVSVTSPETLSPLEFIHSEKWRIENEIHALEPRLAALKNTADEYGRIWMARVEERDEVNAQIEALRIQAAAIEAYEQKLMEVSK